MIPISYFAFRGIKFELRENARIYVLVLSVAVFLAAAAAMFPIMSEFHRMRSDAWHQAEMVYEILARGVPPLEPSYQGLAPQYYWFYQLYVAILSKVSTLGPFEIMSIVSAQFLFLAVLSIYLLSALFRIFN